MYDNKFLIIDNNHVQSNLLAIDFCFPSQSPNMSPHCQCKQVHSISLTQLIINTITNSTLILDDLSNLESIYMPCIDKSSLCFGFPENCLTSFDCKVLFLSQYDHTSGFEFQLISSSISLNKYIAVAFSNILVRLMDKHINT